MSLRIPSIAFYLKKKTKKNTVNTIWNGFYCTVKKNCGEDRKAIFFRLLSEHCSLQQNFDKGTVYLEGLSGLMDVY